MTKPRDHTLMAHLQKLETIGVKPEDIVKGSWIKLTAQQSTWILDYSTKGIERANDDPFNMDGKIERTCRILPAGKELYVADKKINGSAYAKNIKHEWLRVQFGTGWF